MVEFLILSLASFRLTRFFLADSLFDPIRNRIWDRFDPATTRIGYLFTCPWCLGFWISLGLFFCYTIVPLPTMWVGYVLALSAVVGLLSAFEYKL